MVEGRLRKFMFPSTCFPEHVAPIPPLFGISPCHLPPDMHHVEPLTGASYEICTSLCHCMCVCMCVCVYACVYIICFYQGNRNCFSFLKSYSTSEAADQALYLLNVLTGFLMKYLGWMKMEALPTHPFSHFNTWVAPTSLCNPLKLKDQTGASAKECTSNAYKWRHTAGSEACVEISAEI